MGTAEGLRRRADRPDGMRGRRAVKPTDRRRARHARQSTRPRDQGVLTAFRPGPAGPLVWRRLPLRSGSRGRPSRRAEPCPGSASLPRGRPCRLNDENSRRKVQDVRADSSARSPALRASLHMCLNLLLLNSPVMGLAATKRTGRRLRLLLLQERESQLHAFFSICSSEMVGITADDGQSRIRDQSLIRQNFLD